MRGRKRNIRGKGHKFSRNLAPLKFDEDGNLIPDENEKEDAARKARRAAGEESDDRESGSGSEEDSSEEEGSSEEESGSSEEKPGAKKGPAPKAAATIEVSNPNRAKKGNVKLSDLGKPAAGGGDDSDEEGFRKDGQMSRREREAAEKERAKEAYWKAHLAGQTDQARADMARLTLIKKQREEAAQRREAESKAKDSARSSNKSSSLASNKSIVTARVGNLGKEEEVAPIDLMAPGKGSTSVRGGSTAGAPSRGGKAGAPVSGSSRGGAYMKK